MKWQLCTFIDPVLPLEPRERPRGDTRTFNDLTTSFDLTLPEEKRHDFR
jgi:hypothetical protein